MPKNKFKMNLKNEIYHIIDPNVPEKIIYNKDGISNSVGNGWNTWYMVLGQLAIYMEENNVRLQFQNIFKQKHQETDELNTICKQTK